jgi:hypothetical protein
VTKKQFWTRVTVTSVVFITLSVIYAFFSFNFIRWTHHVYNAALLIYGFILFHLTVNAHWSKLTYVLVTITTYFICLCGVANFFEAVFFSEYLAVYTSIYWHIIRIFSLVFTLPLVWRYTYSRLKPSITSSNTVVWKAMWLIPVMFLIIISIYTGIQDVEHISSWQYLSIVIILMIGLFIICDVVLRMVIQTEKNVQLTQKLELQREHYSFLQEHIKETKRVRHNLRYHLTIFQSFINAGETEKLSTYINEYKDSLPDDTEITFCENHAINAILRYYSAIAKNETIKINTHLELPENLSISDSDLCIIFGNCIENAIEACRKINDGKFIKLNSKIAGDMLAVTIDNSFDGVIKKEGNMFISRKHEGQSSYPVSGIGISSVKSVTRKYKGEARFEAKDNVFQASVMLFLHKQGEF